MRLQLIPFTILISILFTQTLRADTIYLKNGNKVSGIITGETEETVEIKINIGATVSFARTDIEQIIVDDGSHAKMKGKWEAEKSRRKVKAAREDEKEKSGLVEYKDKWVTPEEKEKMQAADIAEGWDGSYKESRVYSGSDASGRSSFSRKLLSEGDWLMRETKNFSIFYRDSETAKIISDKAEYYFEKISYDLGYEDEIEWDEKCRVFILESVAKWKDFLRQIGFNAELVGGFVPNYQGKEMYLCALSEGYLAVTFPHELTHLIFNDLAGGRTIPLWLNEGLANYEASVTSISNKLLIKRIKQGRYILLGDILRMTHYPEGKEMREIFYAQSEKMVEFFITQYGREKFREFCDLILEDRSFKDSLDEAYKNDFEDIEDFNIKLVRYIVE